MAEYRKIGTPLALGQLRTRAWSLGYLRGRDPQQVADQHWALQAELFGYTVEQEPLTWVEDDKYPYWQSVGRVVDIMDGARG